MAHLEGFTFNEEIWRLLILFLTKDVPFVAIMGQIRAFQMRLAEKLMKCGTLHIFSVTGQDEEDEEILIVEYITTFLKY